MLTFCVRSPLRFGSICALAIFAYGCQCAPPVFGPTLDFLPGAWTAQEVTRTCSLKSTVNQELIWDEILDWNGTISVQGARTGILTPHVDTHVESYGTMVVTIGDTHADHLIIEDQTEATLMMDGRQFEGQIHFLRKVNGLEIGPSELQAGTDSVTIAGTLELPKLSLVSNEKLEVSTQPPHTLDRLPPLVGLEFKSTGQATLSTPSASSQGYDSKNAHWYGENQWVTLVLQSWNRREQRLKARIIDEQQMELTARLQLNGNAIGAQADTVGGRCHVTQRFERLD